MNLTKCYSLLLVLFVSINAYSLVDDFVLNAINEDNYRHFGLLSLDEKKQIFSSDTIPLYEIPINRKELYSLDSLHTLGRFSFIVYSVSDERKFMVLVDRDTHEPFSVGYRILAQSLDKVLHRYPNSSVELYNTNSVGPYLIRVGDEGLPDNLTIISKEWFHSSFIVLVEIKSMLAWFNRGR